MPELPDVEHFRRFFLGHATGRTVRSVEADPTIVRNATPQAHDSAEETEILGGLGPDAMALGEREFLERLSRRRGGVKAALMDQRFLAGVGNIIADETLWQARIDPRRRIDSLSQDERRRLFRSMRRILRQSVDSYDSIPRQRSWLSSARGKGDAACPSCGSPLGRAVVAGRTTYFCSRCQR